MSIHTKISWPFHWVTLLSKKEQLMWVVGYLLSATAMFFGLGLWIFATVFIALIWSTAHLALYLKLLSDPPARELHPSTLDNGYGASTSS